MVVLSENIMYGMDKCGQEEIEQAARLANIHDFIASLPEVRLLLIFLFCPRNTSPYYAIN